MKNPKNFFLSIAAPCLVFISLLGFFHRKDNDRVQVVPALLVGIGLIFGNYLSGAMRNPSAAQKQFPNLLLGFALAEATGLFGLVVALIILFAF